MLAIAIVRILAGDAVGEFVEMGFPGQHSPGFAKRPDECSVVRGRGPNFREKGRASEGWQARDIEEIFREVGHAGEGGAGGPADRESAGDFFLRKQERESGALLTGRK